MIFKFINYYNLKYTIKIETQLENSGLCLDTNFFVKVQFDCFFFFVGMATTDEMKNSDSEEDNGRIDSLTGWPNS